MAARHRQAEKIAKGQRSAAGVPAKAVHCQECGKAAGLVTGAVIYPNLPEYAERPYWRCLCGAYVGCHPGTYIALGTPCGPETRKARIAAHASLDGLWRRKAARGGVSKGEARGAAYKWAAAQLQIDPAACHIGMMDKATALRVVALCAPFMGNR